MRISDWSSDVCSSDLPPNAYPLHLCRDCPAQRQAVRLRPAIRNSTLPSGPVIGLSTRATTSQPSPVSHPRTSAQTRRSEEHTSELQSLMRISYAVFCLKKQNKENHIKRQRRDITNN